MVTDAVTTERGRWPRAAALALCVAIVAAPALAGDRVVYRSELRDGRVLYADAPVAGAVRVERVAVEAHPANPQQAEQAQRALAVRQEMLLRQGQARSERLAQIDAKAARASEQLQRAQAARVAAQDIVEGDRLGRRFSPAYWQRQQQAADAEVRAQRDLDALARERALIQ